MVGMSDVSPPTPIRKRRVRGFRGRGEVYSWLRAHHSQVAERLSSEQWSLTDLAGEVVRNGLRGRDGVTPTAKAVTKVWQRVCRDVAKAEALKAKKKRPIGGKFPSRIPPNWRPEVVAPPPIRPALPAPVQAGAGASQADDDENLTPEQRENRARTNATLDRLFEEHDRKFRFGGG
jgi:hypothetical protein